MVSVSGDDGQPLSPFRPAGVAPERRTERVSGSRRLVSLLKKLFFVSPTLFALVYFGIVASDRYVSEAQFIIRTASRPVGSTGFGSFLQMAGFGRSQDDIFSVQSFLGSRDAARLLAERLPIRDYYGQSGGDPIAGYPSVIYGSSLEELHKYLGWMITTFYLSNTGITTLRVQAFRPEHAMKIADALLELSEMMVNRMNARIHKDALLGAANEVKRNEERMVAAQVAITRFRNAELTIDPGSSSVIVSELIARLSSELAQAQTQLREMSASTPDSPLIASMQRRVAALELQIQNERKKLSEEEGGLATKIAVYERLVLEREFAKKSLQSAADALDAANTEARRQQLYLERIAQPLVADYPLAPERVRMILTIAAANLLALLMGWLIFSGIEERVAEMDG
ncbi:MAG: capsule biosynthesis protein [Hyphomicrobiaceae bacterium]